MIGFQKIFENFLQKLDVIIIIMLYLHVANVVFKGIGHWWFKGPQD